jgi:hypothetical protein
METFDHAEQDYLNFLAEHADTYIINVPRGDSTSRILVHCAWCGTLRTPKREHYTTNGYFKVAFSERDQAIAYAQKLAKQRGAPSDVCKLCKAMPKK